MRVRLNGEEIESQAASLAELLKERGFGPHVATARNGDFIPAGLRGATALAEGDRLEVLAPMQGG